MAEASQLAQAVLDDYAKVIKEDPIGWRVESAIAAALRASVRNSPFDLTWPSMARESFEQYQAYGSWLLQQHVEAVARELEGRVND